MNYNLLFEKAKQNNIEQFEIYLSSEKETEFNIYKGTLENFKIAESAGMAARGLYNGKMGNTFVEVIDDTMIDYIIEQVINNAKAINTNDLEELFGGANYETVNSFNESLSKVSMDEKIEMMKLIENEVYKVDSRIVDITYCLYGEQEFSKYIKNSKGLEVNHKSNIGYVVVNCVVKENDDTKTNLEFVILNDLTKFDTEQIVKDVTSQALSQLGAKSIDSGSYEIILKNDMSAQFLTAMESIFSAESVQKGVSLLAGKLNNKVFNEKITILDNPLLEGMYKSTPFDDEGYPCSNKTLVENGVLKTYLYNLKTASKDKVNSTGNGFKSSYKTSVGVAPTNLYIENGTSSYDELIKNTKKGIIITQMMGLHAGLNTITADFSLQAAGYLVEDGVVVKPVTLFTIAGNYIDLLNDVELVGNDLKFNSYCIGSPSLKIKKLMVSGK